MPGGETVEILGTRYQNLLAAEAVGRCLELLKNKVRADIFFLNLDCLRLAEQDREYRDILNAPSSLVLPDGIGLSLAARLLGERVNENCNGSDFSPIFIRAAMAAGASFFLLGGKEGVAKMAAERLRESIPDIKIVGAQNGYFQDEAAIVDRINRSGAEILFVAMGAPLQEKFIARNRARLTPCICLGVGALLDYISGTAHRAPRWVIYLRCEWFWRVLFYPRQYFSRYLIYGLGFFLRLVFFRLTHCCKQGTTKPSKGRGA